MAKITQRRIRCGGQEITYILEIKLVKNINMRIRQDGTVYVSANRWTPKELIDQLVLSKADFILKGRAKVAERAAAEGLYTPKHGLEIFTEVLDELYPLFAKLRVPYPALRYRSMSSRWGSCNYRDGIITMNTRLLAAPRELIKYVMLHELCHFIHPNHSKDFHSLVGYFMPDWKERRALLNKGPAYWDK